MKYCNGIARVWTRQAGQAHYETSSVRVVVSGIILQCTVRREGRGIVLSGVGVVNFPLAAIFLETFGADAKGRVRFEPVRA
jgi:hypothetical protein